jgi:3,4-dihydroxy-2-butanone 4-phosphate synthase
MTLSTTLDIIADLKAGRMVVLVDEEDRENEGDLVLAADFVTPEAINFMARHARGLVCLTLTEERCRQLGLPPMVATNRASQGTNFTVSIEAAEGVTTGISAADRARTVLAAIAPDARPDDLVQPGHIFPVMAQEGGVLARAGHTEAGCDLTRLAGRTPASVICEIMKDDGTMARLPDLVVFAQAHGLKIGTIADLIHHRSRTERRTAAHDRARRVPPRRLPRQADRRHAPRARPRTAVARYRDAGARPRAAVGNGSSRRGQHVAFVDDTCRARRCRRGGARRRRAAASPGERAGAPPPGGRRRAAGLGEDGFAQLRDRRADPARSQRRPHAPDGEAAQDAEHGGLRPRGHRLHRAFTATESLVER